jgi:hypothetical protein
MPVNIPTASFALASGHVRGMKSQAATVRLWSE